MTWKETALLAALGVATIIGASSCQHPLPPPSPPAQTDAATPYGDGGATCSSACENILSLGCPDKPSRCVEACENVQASGVFAYAVACITRAQTCADVTACQEGN